MPTRPPQFLDAHPLAFAPAEVAEVLPARQCIKTTDGRLWAYDGNGAFYKQGSREVRRIERGK